MIRNRGNTLYKRPFYVRQRLLPSSLSKHVSPAIDNLNFRKQKHHSK